MILHLHKKCTKPTKFMYKSINILHSLLEAFNSFLIHF